MEFNHIKFVIFREELDLLWIIENQWSENPEMNTSVKIFKLKIQMI